MDDQDESDVTVAAAEDAPPDSKTDTFLGGVEGDAVYDVPVQVSFVLGTLTMQVRKLLGRGDVVEIERKVGDAIDVVVNNRLVARGEMIVVDDRLGLNITEIIKSNGT